MEYQLRVFGVLPPVTLPITRLEFNKLKTAHDGFLQVIDFEEKFDVLMGNYIDLESTIMDSALHSMLLNEHEGGLDLSIARSHVSRRVLNFLASKRLYHKALEFHATAVFGRKHVECRNLEIMIEKKKSASISFQFIDALRNYSQHRALPVHTMTFSHKAAEEGRSATAVIPMIDATLLAVDRRFDKTIMAALTKKGLKFPLMPILRESLECTADIHHEFRARLNVQEQRWTQAYDDAVARLRKAHRRKKIDVVIAGPVNPQDDNDEIWLGHGSYRKYLKRKHRRIPKLSTHFVRW